VQFHLTHIYAKLGVGSRAELAAQFRDNGLSDPDDGGVTLGRERMAEPLT